MNDVDKMALVNRLYKLSEQLKKINPDDSFSAKRFEDEMGSLQQGTDVFVEPAINLLKKHSEFVQIQIKDEEREIAQQYNNRLKNSAEVFLKGEKEKLNKLQEKLRDEYESYNK